MNAMRILTNATQWQVVQTQLVLLHAHAIQDIQETEGLVQASAA